MPKYKDGEYISLVWEDTPDDLFVKGHIDKEPALKAIHSHQAHIVIYPRQDVYECILDEPEHIWARWSCETAWDEGVTHVLRHYDTPGRGRFKVTRFKVISLKLVCPTSEYFKNNQPTFSKVGE